jgi:hypothetical protein
MVGADARRNGSATQYNCLAIIPASYIRSASRQEVEAVGYLRALSTLVHTSLTPTSARSAVVLVAPRTTHIWAAFGRIHS